jgi:hypothetical protein
MILLKLWLFMSAHIAAKISEGINVSGFFVKLNVKLIK